MPYIIGKLRNLSFELYITHLISQNSSVSNSVAYSSQGSRTGQIDSCNWLADGSTTG